MDDKIITDNGDSDKVLASVLTALCAFAEKHPMAWIYAIGTTPARTRLYRTGIDKYFDTAEMDF